MKNNKLYFYAIYFNMRKFIMFQKNKFIKF